MIITLFSHELSTEQFWIHMTLFLHNNTNTHCEMTTIFEDYRLPQITAGQKLQTTQIEIIIGDNKVFIIRRLSPSQYQSLPKARNTHLCTTADF